MNKKSISRCFVYVRVSTDEQTEGEFTSCDAQEVHCKQLIESKAADGWVYVRTCQDAGVSGRKLNRPGLNQLLTAVKRGEVDVVVVYKQDRLARIAANIAAIRSLIEAEGGFVASCTEPSMGTNAISKLVRGLLDQVAEFEVSKGMELVQDKMRARAEQGLWKGGIPPYGYSYDQDNKQLLVVETEAEVVRRVFKDAAAGHSTAIIAAGLRQDGVMQRPYARQLRGDEPGKATPHTRHFLPQRLREMITNPTYRGVVRAKNPDLRDADTTEPVPEWREYAGQHQALVSAEVWHQANKSLRVPKKFVPRLTERDKHGYILKGTLVCARCRCSMSTSFASKRRPDGGFYRYYRCVRATKEGPVCGCNVGPVPSQGLEDAVLGYVQRMVKVPGLTKTLLANLSVGQSNELAIAESELNQLNLELAGVERQLKAHTTKVAETEGRLSDALRAAATELADKRYALSCKQVQVSDRVCTLRSATPGVEQVDAAFNNFVRLVRVLPTEQQKQVITHVFERIEIGRPQSAYYLNAIKAGLSPRLFQIRLFLNTDTMSDLDAIRGGLLPGLRPTANLNTTFTVLIPHNGGSPKLIEGDETIDLPNAISRNDDDQGPPTAANVVVRAYAMKKAQDKEPDLSGTELAKKLDISPATLSIHLKILNQVDPGILAYMKHCKDNPTLKWFGVRGLLELTELDRSAQMSAFQRGLEEAKQGADESSRASA